MSGDPRFFAANGEGGYGKCTICKRRSAESAEGLCRSCVYIRGKNIREVTTDQVAQGLYLLRAQEAMVTWPFPSLAEMTGPIPEGHVVYVVAATGVGKTTFALSCIKRWVEGDVGVTVMPTETRAGEWRLSLAAITLGIPHGDVFDIVAAAKAGDAHAIAVHQQLQDMMIEQARTETVYDRNLYVFDEETVTPDGLDRCFALAAARGHKIVVVDHGDEVSSDRDPITGRRAHGIELVKQVNDAIAEYAKYHKIVAIVMSQANSSINGDGTNPLLRFQPPQLLHVMGQTFKSMKATQILGIYRPLRTGLSRHEFTLARDGVIPPLDVLDTHRMGVNALKLRKKGKNEGNRVELAYVLGGLRDLTQDEIARDIIARSGTDTLAHGSPLWREKPKKTGGA